MGSRDKRIDAYIAKSADFAQPILARLRALVHETCPDVVETLKWSHPSFEYKGILCGMAAFKQHAAFGFWKHEQVVGKDSKAKEAMGSFGCLKTVADLPSKKAFAGFMKTAMRLNDEGIVAVRRKTAPKPKPVMHAELRAALARNGKAQKSFDGFPPSAQREYMEWVSEAKGEDTRARRVKQSVEWMAQGKRRNWKYANC